MEEWFDDVIYVFCIYVEGSFFFGMLFVVVGSLLSVVVVVNVGVLVVGYFIFVGSSVLLVV